MLEKICVPQINFTMHLMCVVAFAGLMSAPSSADEPTNKERQQLRRIKDEIDKAGRLYKAKKYELSAAAIRNAQRRTIELTKGAGPELLEIVTPEYKRLEKAHRLLTDAGQTLRALDPLPPPVSAAGPQISFVNQIAPIIVSRCGSCHVNQNRGDFSAASYQALGSSTMVAVGLPNDSRMIEVIVDGDMPPNGSVPKSELDTLKNWIAQGAKFDGNNPRQNLRQIVRANNSPANTTVTARPTGNETVSFGLHVAPILLDSCGQCHIETNNPRGNLNMGSFRQLLAGGDSGSPISPGDAMASLITQRMSADDGSVMPPSGKLDDKVIDVVRKWIDEGAKFDGGDNDRMPTQRVAAVAAADNQTHEELAAARRALSAKNWQLIMPDVGMRKSCHRTIPRGGRRNAANSQRHWKVSRVHRDETQICVQGPPSRMSRQGKSNRLYFGTPLRPERAGQDVGQT